MNNDNREALKSGSRIVLCRKDEKGNTIKHTFCIENEISRGSSAVAMNAYYVENRTKIAGTLKEFYPYDSSASSSPSFDMERYISDDEKNNQLFSRYGTLETFIDFRNGYVKPYELLARQRSSAKELNYFFPSYELYNGIPYDELNPDNRTVYVWVKNDATYITYKEALQNCCRNLKEGAADGIECLKIILRCMYELAISVNYMHCNSLFHLDLKPENIGVSVLNNTVKENVGISLYDINSLYYDLDRDNIVMSAGTRYFRSPEVAKRNTYLFGIGSDIYSMGAILYYSLVINNRYENVRFCEGVSEFNEDEYNNIAVNLHSSKLIGDSDETQNTILFGMLLNILNKSLNLSDYANDFGSYDTAFEFAADIKKALEYLKTIEAPSIVSKNTEYELGVMLEKKEDVYARKNKNGATGVIQWLLLNYPLYKCCIKNADREDSCNVLVLGAGTFASKFVDTAFELSQIKNCRLNITVVSDNAENDKKIYLAARPEMRNYFTVDGVEPLLEEAKECPYGSLRFVNKKLPDDLKNIFGENNENNYTYCFVSLNDEKKNEEIAKGCRKYIGGEQDCTVAFTAFKKKTGKLPKTKKEPNVTLLRLSVNDTLESHPEYKKLCEMAFNAHLTWASNYINDIPAEEREFRKPYNFYSSLKNVLSVQYKLHSIGIELKLSDNDNVLSCASRAAEEVDKNLAELTMYEHRRWVVEKITDSWRCLSDISSLKGDTKDRLHRKHTCIVPSTKEFSLSTDGWKAPYPKWDDASDDELQKLDPLDRLSVNMYRHYREQAKNISENRGLLNGLNKDVESAIGGDSFGLSIYNDLAESIEKLLTESSTDPGLVKKYNYYRKLLQKTDPEPDGKGRLSESLKKLDNLLYPAIYAAKHTDLKMNDVDLVKNIPFILTYSSSIHLCVPFYVEKEFEKNNTLVFENVASALMLNPRFVTFIVDRENIYGKVGVFQKNVEYCLRVLENHALQTDINIVIVTKSGNAPYKENNIENLKKLSPKVKSVSEITYSGFSCRDALRQYLTENMNEITAIEVRDTKIGGMFESFGDILPVYTFDSKTQKFVTSPRCEFFKYVNNHPSLSVSDLFYSGHKNIKTSEPGLADKMKDLWDIYSGDLKGNAKDKKTKIWKSLSGKIKKYYESSGNLASISDWDSGVKLFEVKECDMYFPSFCKDTLENVLRTVKNVGFSKTKLENYTFTRADAATCILHIKATKNVLNSIKDLLREPIYLTEKSLIDISFADGKLNIKYRSLNIENLTVNSEEKNILKQLEKLGCIYIYKETAGMSENETAEETAAGAAANAKNDRYNIDFTFASTANKNLLDKEGNILELYAYREVLSCGLFDDVKTGITVVADNGLDECEFDLVMTKGFKSYIIECKARNHVYNNMYNTLSGMALAYGINCNPIILADMAYLPDGNNMDIINAGMEIYKIKTIYIVDTLIKMLKNILKNTDNK